MTKNEFITAKKIADSVKDNIYAQHKTDIDKIAAERNVDLGFACSMIRSEKGWGSDDGTDKEITEFTNAVKQLQMMTDKIPADATEEELEALKKADKLDNFVDAYFAGVFD